MRLSTHISDIVIVAGEMTTCSAVGGVLLRLLRRVDSSTDVDVGRRLRDVDEVERTNSVDWCNGAVTGSETGPEDRRERVDWGTAVGVRIGVA